MQPKAKYVWDDGQLIPFDDAKVHVLTHALHYGTAVFDSMRAYPTERGPAIFRNEDHLRRLIESGRLYKMETSFALDALIAATHQLVQANGFNEGCYLRPLMFRGFGAMGVSPLGAPVKVIIAAWEWGAYLGDEARENGVRVGVSSWRRISGDSLLPASKASAHYLNSVLGKLEAIENGWEEAILLDSGGFVSEGTGENVFLVKDGRLITPPSTSSILSGITRRTVIRLARDLGIDIETRSVARSELYQADEIFLTGTAAEITPVREVDRYAIGDRPRGKVTALLQARYEDVIFGRDASYATWLDVVESSREPLGSDAV